MQVGILINIAETSSRPNTKQKLYVFGICASTPHLSQRALCACMPQEHRDQCPGCPATLTADTVAEKFETDILPVDEEFNFHFGLNTTIRSSFNDDYRGLKEHVTGFVYDFKALGTLPVGPREMGAQWYAGALGLFCLRAIRLGGLVAAGGALAVFLHEDRREAR